jgi:hypothetical protein
VGQATQRQREKFEVSTIVAGSFIDKEKIGLGTYRFQNIEGDVDLLPVNGQILNHYISYPLRQISLVHK